MFVTIVGYYLYRFEFKPLASLCIPMLAVFFGFSALLYNRARALPSGSEQRRSLYAAERAMQATVFYLVGLMLALVMVAGLLGVGYEPPATIKEGAIPFPLVIFSGPILAMLWAYICFTYALRALTTRFLRRRPARDILRGIR